MDRAAGGIHAHGSALAHSRFLVEGPEVDEERMRVNLDITNGLVVSEAVTMGLAPYLGREYAHDLVYDICRVALTENRPLLDLPCENAESAQHLDRTALTKLCDPANYLGLAGEMVDRVLERLAR
jgi:3-carboxy-cis,cis-muconate cycloisomerase